MADWAKAASTGFWSEWFWFPENVTWKDLENVGDGVYHPQLLDLLIPFPVALLLFTVRKIFERFVATPLGKWLGISDEPPKQAPKNDVLETAFKQQKKPSQKVIESLAKQTDKSERQVERWYRIRRNQDKPNTLYKFSETCWRFLFYSTAFIYGVVVLWHKSWFWDSLHCWIGYPHHHVSSDIYWYYIVELGFYWSLSMSQFIDVRRKDFYEMFLHHIATISLMTFSWTGNFVRVGTLVLVTHDAVDYWLEGAKMAKYVGAQKTCDFLFGMFGLVWFLTRIVLYPYRVIWTALLESWATLGFFPSILFFNGWLIVLFILHVWWFSIIVRAAYELLTKTGQVQKDSRSESEEEISDSEDESKGTHNHIRAQHNDVSPSKRKLCGISKNAENKAAQG